MTCSVGGCDGKVVGRGWCAKHWRRWWRHGSVADRPPLTAEERFWRKVDRREPDECWPWLGSRNARGYGNFFPVRTRAMPATHAALLYGLGITIPTGKVARHRCDNPPCVNPTHLEVGTYADNMADMRSRGRGRIGRRYAGETNPQAKLDDRAVRVIRSSGESHVALARRFGVSPSAIKAVRACLTWRHLACRDRCEANGDRWPLARRGGL